MAGTIGNQFGRAGDEFSFFATLDALFVPSSEQAAASTGPVTVIVALTSTPNSSPAMPAGHYRAYVEGGTEAFSVLVWKGPTDQANINVPALGGPPVPVLAFRADETVRLQIDANAPFVWVQATAEGIAVVPVPPFKLYLVQVSP
jgi:hypothetical protein